MSERADTEARAPEELAIADLHPAAHRCWQRVAAALPPSSGVALDTLMAILHSLLAERNEQIERLRAAGCEGETLAEVISSYMDGYGELDDRYVRLETDCLRLEAELQDANQKIGLLQTRRMTRLSS